jgi:hypothetical protein
MYRSKPARLMGTRSVHVRIRPGKDDPLDFAPDWSLEAFVFGELKAGKGSAPRDLVSLQPGDDVDVSDAFVALGAAVAQATTRAEVQAHWEVIKAARIDQEISEPELEKLRDVVGKRHESLPPDDDNQAVPASRGEQTRQEGR